MWVLFMGVKWTRHETDYYLHIVPGLRMTGAITSTPTVFLHGVYGDNITFLYFIMEF
jgi:hypothetical protein